MKIKQPFILVFLFFILVSCNGLLDSPYPHVVLTKVIAEPIGERANASSFVIDNKAYIVFGRSNYGSTQNGTDCWQFDPVTDDWIKKSSFPGKNRVGAIAEVVNGIAYTGFGYNSEKGVYDSDSTIFSDFWQYNPQTNIWTRLSDFPKDAYTGTAPLNSCTSFTFEKWIYILGLSAQQTSFSHVWRYDTELGTWQQMADFEGGARTGAVSCNNGINYYVGLGIRRNCLNDWWQYFPKTDTWKELKSVPGKGRINATAFSINNRFFISTGRHFGGTLTDDVLFNDILEYNVQKNGWFKIGELLESDKRENSISFIINNKCYIGLGENDSEIFKSMFVFEP
ncbi:MAG: Kelch repeat-containing protein [Paludibacter sp.]